MKDEDIDVLGNLGKPGMPESGSVWVHIKTGREYVVVGTGKLKTPPYEDIPAILYAINIEGAMDTPMGILQPFVRTLVDFKRSFAPRVDA